MKKRVLVYCGASIASNAYFIQSRSFDQLSEEYEVYVIADQKKIKGTDLKVFENCRVKEARGYHLAPFREFWRRQQLFVNLFGGRAYTRSCRILYEMTFISQMRWPKRFLYRLLGLTPLTAAVFNWVIEAILGLDQDMLKQVESFKPDLIIIPFTASTYSEFEMMKIAKTKSIPLFIFQYGWDNVSTWGIMPFKPDYFGVWGYQSRGFVEKIHGISSNRIMQLGAPFADVFLKPPSKPLAEIRHELKIPMGKKVLLLAGSIRGYNEVRTLKLLDEAISRGDMPDAWVLYRPHPFQLKAVKDDLNYFEQAFKHISLDPALEDQYRALRHPKDKDPNFNKFAKNLVDFDHMRDLISVTSVILAPVSTLMIQGALCGVPSVGVFYTDEENANFNQRHNFEELALLKSMPGGFSCFHPDDLVGVCREALAFKASPTTGAILKAYAGYAIQDDGMNFEQRMKQAVDAILSKEGFSIFSYINRPWKGQNNKDGAHVHPRVS